jgi:YggT family protein
VSPLLLPLALSRVDVAKYVETLLIVYYVLIFVRILMSWLPRVPYNRWLDMVLTFVREVTDPYLNVFRRFMPPLRIGAGALDLSPMVAIIVLLIVGQIVVGLIHG